jgi:hypothetical protein
LLAGLKGGPCHLLLVLQQPQLLVLQHEKGQIPDRRAPPACTPTCNRDPRIASHTDTTACDTSGKVAREVEQRLSSSPSSIPRTGWIWTTISFRQLPQQSFRPLQKSCPPQGSIQQPHGTRPTHFHLPFARCGSSVGLSPRYCLSHTAAYVPESCMLQSFPLPGDVRGKIRG